MIVNEDHLRDVENFGWRDHRTDHISIPDFIETIRALRDMLETVSDNWEPQNSYYRDIQHQAKMLVKNTS